jgi:TPR repeat protein
MYFDGRGVPKDAAQAAMLFKRAADHGNVYAQVLLGRMFAEGDGVPQDFVLAYMWNNLAAAQGWGGADFARDELAKQMTREQIASAQRLSREWKPKAK